MSVDEPVFGPGFNAETRPQSGGATGASAAGRLGIGVIGAGKVGAVLGVALQQAGHTITGVHAVSEASRQRAEAMLPEVPVLEIPEILRQSEMVLFAVPDDVLGELVSGLVAAGHVQTGHLLVHTSGAHGLAVMAPVRSAGAIPLAIHPAMTFTGTSLDVDRLNRCAFGVTADPITLPIAQALVVEMGGEPIVIAEQDRVAYHTALAHASNHLVTIIAQARQILTGIGVEAPEQLLGSLTRAALENALFAGDAALTGPVARGDAGTVAGHLNVLDELADTQHSPDLAAAYRALARATAYRAHRRGTLSERAYRDILAVLNREVDEQPES